MRHYNHGDISCALRREDNSIEGFVIKNYTGTTEIVRDVLFETDADVEKATELLKTKEGVSFTKIDKYYQAPPTE